MVRRFHQCCLRLFIFSYFLKERKSGASFTYEYPPLDQSCLSFVTFASHFSPYRSSLQNRFCKTYHCSSDILFLFNFCISTQIKVTLVRIPYSSLFLKLFSLYCARLILQQKGSSNHLVDMCGLYWLCQLLKGTSKLCVNSVRSANSPRVPATLFLSFFICSLAFLGQMILLLHSPTLRHSPLSNSVSLIRRFNYES